MENTCINNYSYLWIGIRRHDNLDHDLYRNALLLDVEVIMSLPFFWHRHVHGSKHNRCVDAILYKERIVSTAARQNEIQISCRNQNKNDQACKILSWMLDVWETEDSIHFSQMVSELSLALRLCYFLCPEPSLAILYRFRSVRKAREGGQEGGQEGGRLLAGDELTGYYQLCGGLVHKSPRSPAASLARTTQIR